MSRRVLFIKTDAGTLDPRVQKEAATLQEIGWEVTVFGWDRKGEYPKEENRNGVRYHRSRIRGPYGNRMLLAILPLFWIHALKEIMFYRPSVIHACNLEGAIPGLLGAKMIRSKVIYDIFDTFADRFGGLPRSIHRMLTTLDMMLRSQAHAVVVTDDERKKQIAHEVIQRVEVIMNTPPTLHFSIKQRDGGALRICYAGLIHERRGLRLITEAMKGLDGVETTFAGWIPRHEDKEFLQAQSFVRYLGLLSYEATLELITSSDVLLALYDPSIPINRFASSNKVFEAMAGRCPVITNAETTMARIVREVDCGCIIPYGEVSALRDAVRHLRDDPALRVRLGENGHKAFVERYNWELMATRLKSLYEKLCAGPACL